MVDTRIVLDGKQYQQESKLLNRLRTCNTDVVGWYIEEEDWRKNKNDPLGFPVLNSCNLDFCPNCRNRVSFQKKIAMFERFQNLGYIYHWTFSPEYEFPFYAQDIGFIRTKLLNSFKDFFEERGIKYALTYGVHYVGDKNENYQHRWHMHILISTDKEVNCYYEEDRKVRLSNGKEYIRYTDDEKEIIELFKGYLDRSSKFNLKARNEDRGTDFIYFYITDVVEQERQKAKKQHKNFHDVNLMNVVGYIHKYLSYFKEITDIEKYVKYYVYFKMSLVGYAGVIRRGRKVVIMRDAPETFPISKFSNKKLVFVPCYKLYESHIDPISWFEYLEDYKDFLDSSQKRLNDKFVIDLSKIKRGFYFVKSMAEKRKFIDISLEDIQSEIFN